MTNKRATKMKTMLYPTEELHKKPCNLLTLKQKLKLLHWRCKS